MFFLLVYIWRLGFLVYWMNVLIGDGYVWNIILVVNLVVKMRDNVRKLF